MQLTDVPLTNRLSKGQLYLSRVDYSETALQKSIREADAIAKKAQLAVIPIGIV